MEKSGVESKDMTDCQVTEDDVVDSEVEKKNQDGKSGDIQLEKRETGRSRSV